MLNGSLEGRYDWITFGMAIGFQAGGCGELGLRVGGIARSGE